MGAAASAGTVSEPTNIPSRATSADIFLFSEAGNTLGEAFYKSVQTPDLIQFFGDLLAQPYADIPRVQFDAAPPELSSVSGEITVTALSLIHI